MGFDRLIDEVFCKAVDLLAQVMFFQQVPKGQNRRLVWDPLTDQVDASETSHSRHLNQRVLHRWVTQ
jgi:hypothetical protein